MFDNLFFHCISRVCQIKNIKYTHQNLRYYETIVQLLYLSENHLMIYKNKIVTLKNLLLKYIGMKNIIILKRNCHVGMNVVILEVILKLYDACFMKNIFIAPWTCLHRFDLHTIIRWPENVSRVNKICLNCGYFIHCYILLNVVLFFSSSWQSVTISNTDVTTEHEHKSSYFFALACLILILFHCSMNSLKIPKGQ